MSEQESPNLDFDLWLEERHRDIVGTRFRVKQTLFSEQSPYQKIDVVETAGHGNMLLNDGIVMISERDEHVYHEMMAHVPLLIHPHPKRVLIIGGGDGGTAREVIRHPSVQECRLVEIDEAVVRACQKWIPKTAQALEDPKVQVEIRDGVQFAQTTEETFDVILIDSTDPFGPAEPLFGENFYSNIRRILNHPGIVIAQGESPFYEVETQKKMLGILENRFEMSTLYHFSNLTYPGGLWSFMYASNALSPLRDFDEKRYQALDLKCHYYNQEIHQAAFAQPEHLKKALGLNAL